MNVRQELEQIAINNDGLLTPKAVLEFARSNKDSALYNRFTWDDTEAAEKWRTEEARTIIQVEVTKLDTRGGAVVVRAWHSLPQDRGTGGYRLVSDVLQNDNWRSQLLGQAKADFLAMKKRYSVLEEVGKAADAAIASLTPTAMEKAS